MVGDVGGYCTLKSVKTVNGFAGDPKELLDVLYLEIWDIAVDNSGFMVFSPKHNLLAVVDMADVKQHFFCGVVNDIIVPPDLSFFDALIDKTSRKGTWDRNPFVFVYEYERID